ncbi:hypothetical protein LC087_02190 [Bacillus carboniphilus]|uniref:AI-2E family transporter n=1 Tax=Bacillus carboniphilus TaxID=86663 RepID=A0ABY9JX98_9BACI|nr:hypothetical protein [Bacillus carboniphilus]WLR43050.1 hypothetical protein LC087_02190 [Bacillus carboniphilus]
MNKIKSKLKKEKKSEKEDFKNKTISLIAITIIFAILIVTIKLLGFTGIDNQWISFGAAFITPIIFNPLDKFLNRILGSKDDDTLSLILILSGFLSLLLVAGLFGI